MAVGGQSFKGYIRSGAGVIATSSISYTLSGGDSGWRQIVASTSGTLYLLAFTASTSAGQITFDLGVGAAGSEVVIASSYAYGGGRNEGPMGLAVPIRIPAGSRLSSRSNASGFGQGVYVAILYCTESSVY